MSENEVKKCPKCGREMEEGERFLFPFFLLAEETGDKTILFSCKNCGYIELYKEMKKKKDEERCNMTTVQIPPRPHPV